MFHNQQREKLLREYQSPQAGRHYINKTPGLYYNISHEQGQGSLGIDPRLSTLRTIGV